MMNTIVAHNHLYVIGVDTHAATHTFAILTNEGIEVDAQTFPTANAGMRRALAWAGRRTGGDLAVLWAIEGIGSYGAGLARTVTDTGYSVVEAPDTTKRTRRGIGKSDVVDAHRIAAATLPLRIDQLRTPRADEGSQAALRILLTARDTFSSERTRAVNALTAQVRTIDLGIDTRRPLNRNVISQIANWRTREEAIVEATARAEAIRLAKRIRDCDDDLKTNDTQIAEIVADSPATKLLTHTGIGPVTAATALVAWSHPGRVRSEAAYAALAGVSPLPTSSGNTVRHRLNRGGDRKLNRALNVMAMVRMVHDPEETRTYVEKRRAEGKTDREIRRVLKRYLARKIYRHFNQATAT